MEPPNLLEGRHGFAFLGGGGGRMSGRHASGPQTMNRLLVVVLVVCCKSYLEYYVRTFGNWYLFFLLGPT